MAWVNKGKYRYYCESIRLPGRRHPVSRHYGNGLLGCVMAESATWFREQREGERAEEIEARRPPAEAVVALVLLCRATAPAYRESMILMGMYNHRGQWRRRKMARAKKTGEGEGQGQPGLVTAAEVARMTEAALGAVAPHVQGGMDRPIEALGGNLFSRALVAVAAAGADGDPVAAGAARVYLRQLHREIAGEAAGAAGAMEGILAGQAALSTALTDTLTAKFSEALASGNDARAGWLHGQLDRAHGRLVSSIRMLDNLRRAAAGAPTVSNDLHVNVNVAAPPPAPGLGGNADDPTGLERLLRGRHAMMAGVADC